jgi:hypothetical protein
MIFVVSDRTLGTVDAAEDVFGGLVLEEVAGTFSLILILFLLFSLGELGITRGVICGSPGLVSSSSLGLVNSCSPGVVICGSIGDVSEGADSAVEKDACSSRTTKRKSRSSAVCIHGCQRNR